MAKGQKTYTEEDIAQTLLVLASNKGNLLETCRQTGVPFTTIACWRDGKTKASADPRVREKAGEYELEFASIILTVAEKMLARLNDEEKMDASTLPQLSVAFGTLVDKAYMMTDIGKALALREKGEQAFNARLNAVGEGREADPQAD